jgi:hypothetical protein
VLLRLKVGERTRTSPATLVAKRNSERKKQVVDIAAFVIVNGPLVRASYHTHGPRVVNPMISDELTNGLQSSRHAELRDTLVQWTPIVISLATKVLYKGYRLSAAILQLRIW